MYKAEITGTEIEDFKGYLLAEERSRATVEKYIRDVTRFYTFSHEGHVLSGCPAEDGFLTESMLITKEKVVEFKAYLSRKYKPSSVNSMLAAINCFLGFLGLPECKVKLLKVQRRTFRSKTMELSKQEYRQLVESAKHMKNERLDLIMETICASGIRVGELKFITVDAVNKGYAEISNKGKERTIIIPGKLQDKLEQYCKIRNICSGCVFVTKAGRPVNRSNIWRDMKKLCVLSGVAGEKVYPHNLRHLFALTYYRTQGDIVHLADILGHSNIETTRIYTINSRSEQGEKIEQLELTI